MKHIVATAGTALVITLMCLAGCGSAGGSDVNEYQQDCVNNGGQYIDYETEGDACIYGKPVDSLPPQ